MAEKKVHENAAAIVHVDSDGNHVVKVKKGGRVIDTIAPTGDDEFDRARAQELADMLSDGPVSPDQLIADAAPPANLAEADEAR